MILRQCLEGFRTPFQLKIFSYDVSDGDIDIGHKSSAIDVGNESDGCWERILLTIQHIGD